MMVFYLCLGDLWGRPMVVTCAWRPTAGGSVPDTPVFPPFQPLPPPPSSPPRAGGCYSGCWLMWLDPQTCNRDDNSWCWATACAHVCVHECMQVCVSMCECVCGHNAQRVSGALYRMSTLQVILTMYSPGHNVQVKIISEVCIQSTGGPVLPPGQLWQDGGHHIPVGCRVSELVWTATQLYGTWCIACT